MAQGYIIEKHPSGGKIHPTRRRADVYFHAGDADDFACDSFPRNGAA